jgi:hypothetical protein
VARDLHNDFKAEIVKDVISPIILIELAVAKKDASGNIIAGEEYVRAWTGFGTLSFNGNDFIGGGNFIGISEMVESSDTSADGIAISLSGIPSDLLAISLGQVQHGRKASVWFGLLDSNLGIVDDSYKIFSGFSDVTSISEQGETSTISVNIENRLIALETPKVRRYTDQIQRQTYPNDKGFEFVTGLQEKEFVFGE